MSGPEEGSNGQRPWPLDTALTDPWRVDDLYSQYLDHQDHTYPEPLYLFGSAPKADFNTTTFSAGTDDLRLANVQTSPLSNDMDFADMPDFAHICPQPNSVSDGPDARSQSSVNVDGPYDWTLSEPSLSPCSQGDACFQPATMDIEEEKVVRLWPRTVADGRLGTSRSLPISESGSPLEEASQDSALNGLGRRKPGRNRTIRTVAEEVQRLGSQRERNRLAARRCRDKQKLEMLKLDKNVDRLERKKKSLQSTINQLRSEMLDLRETLMMHCSCTSEEINGYLHHQLDELAETGLKQANVGPDNEAAGEQQRRN